MLRSQNFSYVIDYLNQAKKAGMNKDSLSIALLRKINEIASIPDYQPGCLRYAGIENNYRNLLAEFGVKPVMGMGETTWCNFVAERILFELGYDTNTILNQDYISQGRTIAMAYTTVERMYALAKKNCTELNWKDGVREANNGIPIAVIALGKPGNSAHIGIVAPAFLNLDNVKVTDIIIGQGGFYNGFVSLGESFPKNLVGEPSFFKLKKRG